MVHWLLPCVYTIHVLHNYGICALHVFTSRICRCTRKIIKQFKYRMTGDNSKKMLCGYKVSFKRTNMGLFSVAYIFNTYWFHHAKNANIIANGQYCTSQLYYYAHINTCVVRGIAFCVRITMRWLAYSTFRYRGAFFGLHKVIYCGMLDRVLLCHHTLSYWSLLVWLWSPHLTTSTNHQSLRAGIVFVQCTQ